MWDAFIPLLSQKHRIITIDLLGHGHTEPRGYVQTMEDNADVVSAVLAALRIRKCVLVGHSMGGYVALAFAELHPGYIRGIALLNSSARADSAERKANRDRAIKAVKQNYTNFVRLSIANLFGEHNRERLATTIEQVKREALKTPLQGIVASLEGMKVRKDRERLLHVAKYPLLLVLGKQDPVLNYEESLEQIRDTAVKLVTFPDGHMSPIENEHELLQLLADFLKPI